MICATLAAGTPRFGGGMTGYFQYADVTTVHGNPAGLAWGLGGRAHFYLGKLLRVGGMGSTWRLGYSTRAGDDSFLTMGYGGLTADFVLELPVGRVTLGAFGGGGRMHNLHIYARTVDDTVSAAYDSYATMLVAPQATYEFPLTKSINLVGILDWLVGTHIGIGHSTGYPAVRIGIIFNK
jgi:hypothetical protein